MSSRMQARAKLAAYSRHHPDDAEGIADARRELKAAMAEAYVEKLVAEAPPLTVDQLATLTRILVHAANRGDRTGDAA